MNILIVDDSALLRSILRQVLQSHADVTVLYEAVNGAQALTINRTHAPDLIIMDISMPIMDGLEATERIMQEKPTPILILSNEIDSSVSYRALTLGALDVMKKPDLDQFNNPEFFREFITRLKALASRKPGEKPHIDRPPSAAVSSHSRFQMMVIGSSTGGPKALSSMLGSIPGNFPMGIVIVQHLEAGFDEGFARWLNGETALTVRLARNSDFPEPGEAIVAPVGKHAIFSNESLLLDDGPKVLNQKPSIDRLFITAAERFESQLIGILLTGMGTDGAEGCVTIKSRGGYTIAQDKSSSTVYGMPRAAVERGGATKVLPLSQISQFILRLTGQE